MNLKMMISVSTQTEPLSTKEAAVQVRPSGVLGETAGTIDPVPVLPADFMPPHRSTPVPTEDSTVDEEDEVADLDTTYLPSFGESFCRYQMQCTMIYQQQIIIVAQCYMHKNK